MALKIKEQGDLTDPLELRVSPGPPPTVRLMLGELILAEEPYTPPTSLPPAPQPALLPEPAPLERRAGAALRRIGARVRALRPPKLRVSSASILGAMLLAGLTLYPAWLVFRERWLEYPARWEKIEALWQPLPFALSAYPSYFLVVMACLAALLIFVLLQPKANRAAAEALLKEAPLPEPALPAAQIPTARKQLGRRVLAASLLVAISFLIYAVFFGGTFGFGWAAAGVGMLSGLALQLTPPGWLRAAWRRLGSQRWAMLGAHLALLGWLASLYAGWLSPWATGTVLAGALIWLARHRRQVPAIYWIANAALVLYSLQINGWWFAVVGDEYTFFREAVRLAYEGSLEIFNRYLLDGTYVYDSHPFLSTVLQSAFVKAFGPNNFGWRISNPYFAAISILFFYSFFATFLRKGYALIASMLLAGSHYIMTFGKVGYNNLQALLAFGVLLAAAAWALRARSAAAFMGLGLATAFCFYVYPAALYVAPLGYLLLLFFSPPRGRTAGLWALSLAVLAFFILPLFFQPDYWTSKVAGTAAFTPELVQSSSNALEQLLKQFIYSLLSPLYMPEERYFISVGYMDFLSAALAFMGLAALLGSFWRNRFYSFLLVGFALLLFLAGMSHDRTFPPGTRMFLLLPFLAVFVCIALAWLERQLRGWGAHSRHLQAAAGLALLLILGLNLYQAYPLTYRRMTGYQNFESVFLRTSAEYFGQHRQEEKRLLVVHDPNSVYIPALAELLGIYQVPYQPEQLVGIEALDAGALQPLQAWLDEAAVVVVDLRLPREVQLAVSQILRSSGRQICMGENALGHTRFYVWRSTPQAWLCTPRAAKVQ